MAGRRRLLLLLFSACSALVKSASVQGELPEARNFGIYAGKFCFDYTEEGWGKDGPPVDDVGVVGDALIKLEYLGSGAPKSGRLYFMVFDDEKQHWKQARRNWDRSTCEEKQELSSRPFPVDFQDGKGEVVVKIRQHIRPRFWYYTFVGCDLEIDGPIRYSIHSTNTLHGFEQEFSLDHMGLLRAYEIFTIAFGVAGVLTIWAARSKEAAQGLPLREHPYLQLLKMAYIASAASCALFLAHYYLFMKNGFGSLRIRFLAVFAGVVANCTIYLIAILSSRGWAITESSLPYRRLFLGVVMLIGCIHAWTELKAEVQTDQSTQLYSYQGSAGVLSMVLKLFMFSWFGFQVKSSFDDYAEPKIRRFYKYLGVSIGAWAINIPVMVVLAFQLSPWVRYKVVTIVDIAARLLGLVILSQLFCGPLSPLSKNNTFNALTSNEVSFGFEK